MILKASQRGAAMQLGRHLLNTSDNEHVEVVGIRGFIADDVLSAMKEAEAVSLGTRCRQHLFSVSLSPPADVNVGMAAFDRALDKIETAHGLENQPRILVAHEKEGRRHLHAVWSRVDAGSMTAIQLSHFKLKLREISRALYLENGWTMPRGLMKSAERDPHNFGLAEWQQAKRMGRDPRELTSAAQECWAISDSRSAFARALETRGLYLARGERRDYVAVTYEGEILSIARLVGQHARQIRMRLGKSDDFRSVADARAHIAGVIAPRLDKIIAQTAAAHGAAMTPLIGRKREMATRHEAERQRLADGQAMRRASEAVQRRERFRPGVTGMWDRLTGRHAETVRENERDAWGAHLRDRAQRDLLIGDQLKERRALQSEIQTERRRHATTLMHLHRDLSRQRAGAVLRPRRDRASERTRGLGL